MAATTSKQNALAIYTIYNNPTDHPGLWVLRIFDVPGGPRDWCITAKSLEEIRAHVPIGLIKMQRAESDDPVIHETWM